MGLNLSNLQIARELDLNGDDVQAMTAALRACLVARAPAVQLEGVVEIDEVYVVAGHKGNPAAVKKSPAGPAPATSRCARPRHAGEGKSTILGLIQRGG
jgi:hypothetical protein